MKEVISNKIKYVYIDREIRPRIKENDTSKFQSSQLATASEEIG